MPTIADRYEMVRTLGRGSFGHTWLARDCMLGRDVAVKVFDPRGGPDFKARELFEREVAVLRGLRHPGIPAVFDSLHAELDGTTVAMMVMEYIDGVSLEEMIERRHTLDASRVLELTMDLLGIIEYLHSRVPPILHRDIKPSNILVRSDGTPVLLDFGSVRRVFLMADETGSTVAGTYGYMPYEQYMGQATPSSDLYSLAATMLHLVTGRPPQAFIGDAGSITVPADLPVDSRFRDVIARMLRSSPSERFACARDVKQAFLRSSVVATDGVVPAVPVISLAGANGDVPAMRQPVLPAQLPRAPTREIKALVAANSPGMFELMDTSAKPSDTTSVLDVLSLVFFSVVTAGVLPLVFLGYSRARRRRMKRFITHGTEAMGIVREVGSEPTAFGEKIAIVKYEFEADGALRRDADRILPAVAQRMAPGDVVRVLYIAKHHYDSVLLLST